MMQGKDKVRTEQPTIVKMERLQILITQNPTDVKHKGMGIQNWIDSQLYCYGTVLQISDQAL